MQHAWRVFGKYLAAISIALGAAQAMAADAKPAGLVLNDDEKCTSCHDESDDAKPTMQDLHPSVLSIGKTRHGTRADGRTPSCTSCHGESDAHRRYRGSGDPPKPDIWFSQKTNTPVETRDQSCLSCHKGGNRMGWHLSAHGSQDVSCSSCHRVHAKQDKVRERLTQAEVCFSCHKEQRSQVSKPSHHPIVEGKMNCSSCHNVHGDNPKQLVKSSTNDTCFTCHMEKRGPFVHNHQPVTEDCGICHQPHGTTTASLLKTRVPFLCQECHSHDSHPGQAASLPNAPSNSTGMLGTVARGCLNCHTNIHGGNSTVNSATSGRFRR